MPPKCCALGGCSFPLSSSHPKLSFSSIPDVVYPLWHAPHSIPAPPLRVQPSPASFVDSTLSNSSRRCSSRSFSLRWHTMTTCFSVNRGWSLGRGEDDGHAHEAGAVASPPTWWEGEGSLLTNSRRFCSRFNSASRLAASLSASKGEVLVTQMSPHRQVPLKDMLSYVKCYSLLIPVLTHTQ